MDLGFEGLSTGDRIKYFRKSKGLTQLELAEKIGVTQSAITFWEKGKGIPNLKNMVAIAEALSVTIYILCDDETFEAIRKKVPHSNEITSDTLDAGMYATWAGSYGLQLDSVEEELRKYAGLIATYDKLNDKGKSLFRTLIEVIAENEKYTK